MARAVALAALAVLLLCTTAEATFTGTNGKLAYGGAHDQHDSNQEIWSSNPEGIWELGLTNDPGYDFDPAWSPDGTKIAWTHGTAIWLMNADGTGQTVLSAATPYERQPSWSP